MIQLWLPRCDPGLSRLPKDLAAAALDLEAPTPLVEDALFHSQQVVEKVLKGFLAWNGQAFRKTHSLVELGESCVQIEPLLRRAAPLSEHAWKFRYPGEAQEPSRREAEETLTLASEVYKAIRARIPPEV